MSRAITLNFRPGLRMDSRQPGGGIADAAITADLQGAVLTWDYHAEALFGYSAAEAVGRALKDLLLLSERDVEPRGPDACVYEALRRRKDGGLLYVNVYRSAVRRDSAGASQILYCKRDVMHASGTGAHQAPGGATWRLCPGREQAWKG